jgi:hypothetical protein
MKHLEPYQNNLADHLYNKPREMMNTRTPGIDSNNVAIGKKMVNLNISSEALESRLFQSYSVVTFLSSQPNYHVHPPSLDE